MWGCVRACAVELGHEVFLAVTGMVAAVRAAHAALVAAEQREKARQERIAKLAREKAAAKASNQEVLSDSEAFRLDALDEEKDALHGEEAEEVDAGEDRPAKVGEGMRYW